MLIGLREWDAETFTHEAFHVGHWKALRPGGWSEWVALCWQGRPRPRDPVEAERRETEWFANRGSRWHRGRKVAPEYRAYFARQFGA